MLYHHPKEGVLDHGLSFNLEKLRTIKSQVENWDLQAILPSETKDWCQNFLSLVQFSFENVIFETDLDRTKPLLHIYLQFQHALRTHIQSN